MALQSRSNNEKFQSLSLKRNVLYIDFVFFFRGCGFVYNLERNRLSFLVVDNLFVCRA